MKPKKGGNAQHRPAAGGDGTKHEKPTRAGPAVKTKLERRRKDHGRERDSRKGHRQRPPDRSHPAADPAAGVDSSRPPDPRAGAATVAALALAAAPRSRKARPRPPRPALRPGRPSRFAAEPILLARGMSARHLSARVAHRLAPLAKDGVERDLRHMEAYRQACHGYDQQLFVFQNQDLVRGGYFGAFAPLPGQDDARACPPASAAAVPPLLPVRLDPEEEKRAALVRRQAARAEAARERLESGYLALRAHYVHEGRRARRTQAYEVGRWRLLRDVLDRRGRALGLVRAAVAVARDAAGLLRSRGTALATAQAANERRGGPSPAAGNGAVPAPRDWAAADPARIWDRLDAELRETAAACAGVETPPVLARMAVGAVAEPPLVVDAGCTAVSSKGRKRGGSVASAGEWASGDVSGGRDINRHDGGKRGMGGDKAMPVLASHIVPWDCALGPRTPHGVPLLLSCLGEAPDNAMGYVADRADPAALTWLLPDLAPHAATDTAGLARLRAEAHGLEDELARERDKNAGLRRRIAEARARRDGTVALMQVLRAETEAVLERHNVIMDTPAARAKSAELHRRLMEEEKPKHSSAEEEDEEEDEEDLSSAEDGDLHDDEDDEDGSDAESVGIREITVRDSDPGAGEEESDVGDDDASEEGVVMECDNGAEAGEVPGGGEEPRRSRRRHGPTDDEESLSLTPPANASLYRKRRRY